MMDCSRCQDLLLDYLDGTLDEATVREVQAELQHCSECRAVEAQLREGMNLAAQLPVPPMPESLQAKLLAAAEAQAAKAGTTDAGKQVSGGGFFGGLFEQLQALLAGPQAAMATLLVLIVAGTVFVAPVLMPSPESMSAPEVASEAPAEELSPSGAAPASAPEQDLAKEEGAAQTEAEPEEVAELAPAGKAVPAAPSALKDAIGSRGYGAGEKASKPQRERSIKGKASTNGLGSLSADGQRARARRAASGAVARPKKARPATSDDALSDLGSLSATEEREAPAPARSGGGSGRGADSTLRAESAYAPPPPAAQDAEQAAPQRSARLDEAKAAAPSPVISQAASAPEPASAYERGLVAYRQGSYRTAATLLRSALNEVQTKAERDEARRHLARSLRRLGLCKEALPHYEVLLQSGPTNWRPELVQDGAACYEALGRKDEAERLRKRYQ